jgi:hypothetical protein
MTVALFFLSIAYRAPTFWGLFIYITIYTYLFPNSPYPLLIKYPATPAGKMANTETAV